ncbi:MULTISPECIES: glutaredoxin family protein [unclassified Paludibacterium]|uniref:glutaredoxin family protein n=1 Tax=unclassified Paludibacterium TaxID=2618429 RepID=UPI001C05D7FF|nr:glutaredoxin family protein [Paludibacterium sp. B53371]BEV71467.1 glutaredoxin family protein [Paludibacterium sp. THUN1379]
MTLTLYFREYCSLCHQMLAELAPWRAQYGFGLEVVDVDEDPQLTERFDELVPVLMDGETEICHYHLDTERLAAHLREIS